MRLAGLVVWRLAHNVREDRRGRLWLEFATGDPLSDVVPALAVPEVVDLASVPIGLQEDVRTVAAADVGNASVDRGRPREACCRRPLRLRSGPR